jgi:hypothetical protein
MKDRLLRYALGIVVVTGMGMGGVVAATALAPESEAGECDYEMCASSCHRTTLPRNCESVGPLFCEGNIC